MTEHAKKPRRRRADSAAAAIEDVQAAYTLIEPPADMKLDERERIIFAEVIDELPKSEWTPHSVRMAALLALDMCALEREGALLREEGSVLFAANGSPIGNPRQRVVNGLARTILAARRSLSLHARAKAGGDNRVLGQRRAIQRGHEALVEDIDGDDDLLARPDFAPMRRRH